MTYFHIKGIMSCPNYLLNWKRNRVIEKEIRKKTISVILTKQTRILKLWEVEEVIKRR